MTTKRMLTLFLVLAMLWTLASCNPGTKETPEETQGVWALEFITGSTTEVDKYFIYGFTNSAMNARAKELMYAYETIVYTEAGTFEYNDVVLKSHEMTENEDGSHTYTFTINEDLVYSDGSKIDAADFCFSALYGFSPAFGEVGGDNTGGDMIVGGLDYTAGTTDKIEGIRLIDEYTFSLTIPAEELPNHYEIAFAAIRPTPRALYAPGVEVKDDGDGVYLEGDFDADVLNETVLDPDNGQAFKPTATCGPYKFESYDASTSTAILVADENYKGNLDGSKATVERIILKLTVQDTQMEELGNGAVDLLEGIGDGAAIGKGLDLADEGKVNYVSYPRAGFGYFSFSCDVGPTQFVEVRQAIAYCIDRDEFARTFTGGYGMVVDGYYGASQPEYQAAKSELEAKLIHYTLDLDKAVELLEEGGWTLNASGGDYTDGIRYKKLDDGTLMPLILEWASSENNQVSDMILTNMVPNAESIGIKINQNLMTFAELLDFLYRTDGVQHYNMFNLATGFATINTYWYDFNPDDEYISTGWNQTGIKDEQLYAIALEMKKIPSEDWDTWLEKWVELQVRYNELMPLVPLYSNLYHDFITTDVDINTYRPSPLWAWNFAIQRATFVAAS